MAGLDNWDLWKRVTPTHPGAASPDRAGGDGGAVEPATIGTAGGGWKKNRPAPPTLPEPAALRSFTPQSLSVVAPCFHAAAGHYLASLLADPRPLGFLTFPDGRVLDVRGAALALLNELQTGNPPEGFLGRVQGLWAALNGGGADNAAVEWRETEAATAWPEEDRPSAREWSFAFKGAEAC